MTSVDELMTAVFAYGRARVDVDRSNSASNQKACGDSIEAIRSLASSMAAPQGWKLVPIEPTQAMVNEGRRAMREGGLGVVTHTYDAMLSAASAVPSDPKIEGMK